jgi:hypothetical protein
MCNQLATRSHWRIFAVSVDANERFQNVAEQGGAIFSDIKQEPGESDKETTTGVTKWRKRRAFPSRPEMTHRDPTGWLTMQCVSNQSLHQIP